MDKKTFLIWLVQLMAQCTLVQAGFALRLCDEYFDDVVTSRALTKCFVEGIASKLYEVTPSAFASQSTYRTLIRFALRMHKRTFLIQKSFSSPCSRYV